MVATTPRRSRAAAYAFLGLCSGLIALHFLLPRGGLPQAMSYFSVGFISFLAVVVGILLNRPERTVHLWLLGAGLGLLSLGDAIWNVYDWVLEIERPFPSVADWAYLSGYVGIIGAFLLLLRSRQKPSVSDVLDGAIVLAGASLLLWFALMKPAATDAALSPMARIVSTAYPAADVLLLIVLAQLLVAPHARSFSFRALALGAAVLFATDVIYGAEALGGSYEDGGWLDAGWMISTTLWGAAVLHPSIRALHQRTPLRAVTLTYWRLAMLGAATLVIPLVIVLYDDGAGLDSGLIAAAAAITLLLVFARMTLLFREHDHAVVALRDAEARRAVKETTRIANERFHVAARALECAIYELIPNRDRIIWSDGLAAAFGYPEEVADSSNAWFLRRVHPDDREAVASTLHRVAAGERSGQTTYRFQAGDGSYRDVLDRWIVRPAPDGSVAGVIGGMVDVTESRELEAQLRQAQKMEAVGRLAGGVAHDFNNLLTAIAGNAELLTRSPRLAAEEREHIAEIRHAAGQAAELTRRLLAFSRNDVRAPAVVALNDAVAAASTMLRRLLGSDITIVEELGEGVGAVRSDAVGVEQMVVNLALNARDAMPRGGTLRLRTEAEEGMATLCVEDDGFGMDPDTAARALEPFFTTKEVGKGTGLGLASVYGIVQRAGGTIQIESEVGAGTRVSIRLPQVDVPEDDPPQRQPGGAGGSETVLLVEDEPAVRDLVSRMLEAFGYEVVAAAGSAAALELLRDESFRPDVLVSDLVMPGLGGAGLADRARELRPGLPVVFISGYSDAVPAEHPLVAKPFTAAELTQAIRQVIARGATV